MCQYGTRYQAKEGNNMLRLYDGFNFQTSNKIIIAPKNRAWSTKWIPFLLDLVNAKG